MSTKMPNGATPYVFGSVGGEHMSDSPVMVLGTGEHGSSTPKKQNARFCGRIPSFSMSAFSSKSAPTSMSRCLPLRKTGHRPRRHMISLMSRLGFPVSIENTPSRSISTG